MPGSAGSESPLAIVPGEYLGDELMVCVVEFPGDGSSISVGGMYHGAPNAPCQAVFWHSELGKSLVVPSGNEGKSPQGACCEARRFCDGQMGGRQCGGVRQRGSLDA